MQEAPITETPPEMEQVAPQSRPSLGDQAMLRGLPASPGIVIGRVHVVDNNTPLEIEGIDLAPEDVEREVEAFEKALAESRQQVEELRHQVAERLNEGLAAIFDYHLLILKDPMLIDATISEVREKQRDAASVFSGHITKTVESFRKIEDPYFRARSADVTDVARRMLGNLGRLRQTTIDPNSYEQAVIVAHDLSPSDTAHLDPTRVAGFVTDKGGPTSHTAILARSLNIPAIVGADQITSRVFEGQRIIVDAMAGKVILNPKPEILEKYREYQERYRTYEKSLGELVELPSETPDGFVVELAGNVELPTELEVMKSVGSKSIGLYRTEFLFLEDSLPSETEQLGNYTQALQAVGKEGTITFRTLDIGGDKTAPALPYHEEDNPYLGLRAIRFCLEHRDLFRTQLRALLQASAIGNTRLMLPMISSVGEIREARALIYDTMEQLDTEGIAYDGNIPIGVMVEVPSAALLADKLAREADFFSIGTNDLIQYTLAVDRGNDLVAKLYNPYDPAVLRLIAMTIEAAHRNGIPVNVCGEMGSDPVSAILLLGMGIDSLSLNASAIPRIKQVIRRFELNEARRISNMVLRQGSGEEIQKVIDSEITPIIREMSLPLLEISEESAALEAQFAAASSATE